MSSWVTYLPDHPFPIQNLPYGSCKRAGRQHICTAIGDNVVDLGALAKAGLFADAAVTAALQKPELNEFMGLAHAQWKATRATLQQLFSADCATLKDNAALVKEAVVPANQVEMVLPCHIGDYTDCYASKEHATNLGKMFRPGAPPLMENWLHMPIGYHGRASSIVVSGTPLTRPNGQLRPDPNAPPVFGPCKLVDFEVEMAAYVGGGNALGETITVEQAREKVFGFSLFNDWSARDIQKFEYVPLGPFLGKNFGSTISPWIVTTLALEPFLVDTPAQDPAPAAYLQQQGAGNYDISMSAAIRTAKGDEMVVTSTNFKYMYWSVFQQLAHHTVNGCNMRPGDVIASGTISGPTEASFGSMLELAWQGTKPLTLPGGEQRKMIADGDTVIMTGECVGNGFRIGFGEASSKILPAKNLGF